MFRLALALLLFLPTTAVAKTRIWIDTDPACGLSAISDPDDCFALLHLLTSPSVEIAGISTTFGNTSQNNASVVARELLSHWRGVKRPSLFQGAESGIYLWRPPLTAASEAIAAALRRGPLTIVALGPLTNIAAALSQQPELSANMEVVAVMGKQPGEIFHPAEGSPSALLGHGPIFSDLNFASDPRAAWVVLASEARVTLAPYAAGKTQTITQDDLNALTSLGGAGSWVAIRARRWLTLWRKIVGRDGFYPFDLVAAIVATAPSAATCDPDWVVIKHDDQVGWFGFGPQSLLFAKGTARGARPVITCRAITGRAATRLIIELSRESAK